MFLICHLFEMPALNISISHWEKAYFNISNTIKYYFFLFDMKIYMIEDVLKIRNTINLFFTRKIKGRKRFVIPLWNLKTFISGIGRLVFSVKLNQETLKKFFLFEQNYFKTLIQTHKNENFTGYQSSIFPE